MVPGMRSLLSRVHTTSLLHNSCCRHFRVQRLHQRMTFPANQRRAAKCQVREMTTMQRRVHLWSVDGRRQYSPALASAGIAFHVFCSVHCKMWQNGLCIGMPNGIIQTNLMHATMIAKMLTLHNLRLCLLQSVIATSTVYIRTSEANLNCLMHAKYMSPTCARNT